MDLGVLRTYRRDQVADRAIAMSMHPALRFTAGGDTTVGHRRTPSGRAVCGAEGELLIADPGTARCPVCFAHLAAVGAG